MGEKFRLRESQLNIRLTDYEKGLIMEQFKASGKNSLREFIVESVTNGYIINVDYKEIRELAYEINKIGNNINQIAHKVNISNQVYKSDMEELQEDIDLIWRMLRKTFYQIT